jgi:hypothetical protein
MDDEFQDDRVGLIVKNYGGRVVIENSDLGNMPVILENTDNAIIKGNRNKDTLLPGYSVSSSKGVQLSGNLSAATVGLNQQSLGYELSDLHDATVTLNSSVGNHKGFRVNGLYNSIFRDNNAILGQTEPSKRSTFSREDTSRLVQVLLQIVHIVRFPLTMGSEIQSLRAFIIGFAVILASNKLNFNTPYVWQRVFSNILYNKANGDLGIYYGNLKNLLWDLDSLINHMHEDI